MTMRSSLRTVSSALVGRFHFTLYLDPCDKVFKVAEMVKRYGVAEEHRCVTPKLDRSSDQLLLFLLVKTKGAGSEGGCCKIDANRGSEGVVVV
jgi:hypothetical protein